MSAKHTPAPWAATPESNGKEWGVDAGRWGICICADAPGSGTAEANARLIAAAPELLQLAIRVSMLNKNCHEIGAGMLASLVDGAAAAIAKATGEQ